MTIEGAVKADVRKALGLAPLDMLVCEYCGHEICIPPEASGEIKCFRCGRSMDKSHFSPMIRKQKLWVSDKALKVRLKQYARQKSCNCVDYYRTVVRFRHVVLETYGNRGEIRLVQALAIFVALWSGSDEGVLKLLGRNRNTTNLPYLGLDSTDNEKSTQDILWDWLGTVQIKGGVGRPARTDHLLLFLDAVVLMFCPNRYVHFLRDALRLRWREYKVQANHATAHRETWEKFYKNRRAVEVGCKRMWRAWFGETPEPPPEFWWERVAREQGLIG